ncbi:hypothetical protein CJ030_MR1G028900 [Morella rubra]|uniref:Uncharacterized protein n=1 Tax=Morella rubra TaxID=262757 RepID=A0A6A1WSV5_9ROSI|nr:hypothetical protein CJ030_MR1G028900 [Morella rubra]
MKYGREFPFVISEQLHDSLTPLIVSLISSPSPSAPSLRPHTSVSQGMQAFQVVVHRHMLLSTIEVEHTRITSTLTTIVGGREDSGGDYDDDMSNVPEQNKINRSKLTVNHAARSLSFQRTRACMKNLDNGKINPAELYKKNYTNKDASEGNVNEIEAMRAAREKDLQYFTKKQAKMEATLRNHRDEHWVEKECIRLKQEERMKRSKSACERSKSAYGQKYQRSWSSAWPL